MSSSAVENDEIFQQLEEYPWDEDTQFQGGLSAILGNATSPTQIQELTLRAQCFYLARKMSTPIDFDAYKSYLASKSTNQATPPKIPSESAAQRTELSKEAVEEDTSSTTKTELVVDMQSNQALPPGSDKGAAPYPPTFAEIVELITSGAPIPGIKDIPPTLLTSQASKPVASKRRKPWEKDVPDDMVQGAGTALSAEGQGEDGGSRKMEGTFGDHRDEILAQDLPEE